MHISNLSVRFYRSFNYDYLRKQHEAPIQNDWEMLDGVWCPFVSVPIGRYVTTIAGANESGKTQFLNAFACALGTRPIVESDFCRYSEFYSVGKGETRLPDLAIELTAIADSHKELLAKVFRCKSSEIVGDTVRIVMYNGSEPVLLLDRPGANPVKLRVAEAGMASNLLPACHRISAKTPLPDAIPLSVLSCTEEEVAREAQRHMSLSDRARVVEAYQDLQGSASDVAWLQDQDNAQSVLSFLRIATRQSSPHMELVAQYRLARALLLDIAGVDQQRFTKLRDAAHANDEGELRLIEEHINLRLNASLSLPQWWMQDQDFRLQVRTRGDSELSFTVSDRTAATYTFAERSSGLKYFLSYHLQFLLLKSNWETERGSIILMDEPDSFLSSDGQRDLLRLMQDLVQPSSGLAPVQLVYVTHSPFLIDRNQADAVRLLSKGAGDEGVRVIGYAGQRLYEPVHSAIGAAAGDAARYGEVNLVVEGIADQTLLYSISRFLADRGASDDERLDMNSIAIVPAEGAGNVPFEVLSLRARSHDCPAVVVLLDGDRAGQDAKAAIVKGRIGKGNVLDENLIVLVDEIRGQSGLKLPKLKSTPLEIEDLIPEAIATSVARRYMRLVSSASDDEVNAVTTLKLSSARQAGAPLFDSLREIVRQTSAEACRIEKRPFARLLAEALDEYELMPDSGFRAADVSLLSARFRALFSVLNQAIERAREGDARSRMEEQISRQVRRFCVDHASGASMQACRRILSQIEQLLVPGDEATAIRLHIARLRDKYKLHHTASGNLSDFDDFKAALMAISTTPQQLAGRHLTSQPDSFAEGS